MKFLIDECVTPQLAERLRELGHDAAHVGDLNMRGATDAHVLKRALDEGRILVTQDVHDFTGLIGDGTTDHPGLIIQAYVDRRQTIKLMDKLLAYLTEHVHVITPQRYMLNRLLRIFADGRITGEDLPRVA